MARYPQHDERCELADKDEAPCTCGLSALYADRERLTAELAASEALVDALNTQRATDAVAAMRAVEEAREEQREACAAQFWPPNQREDITKRTAMETVRATPLTATPLAERIAELDAGLSMASLMASRERAEKAESRVKEMEAEALERHGCPSAARPLKAYEHAHGKHALTADSECVVCRGAAERDTLKSNLAAMRVEFEAAVSDVTRQRDALKAELAAAKRGKADLHAEAEARRANERELQAQVERLTVLLKRVDRDVIRNHALLTVEERKKLDRDVEQVLKEKTP